MSRRTCQLCGATDQELEAGLTRLAEPVGSQTFGTATRCRDREGCRTRVEASGQRWEWLDGAWDREHGRPTGFTQRHLEVFAANRAWGDEMRRTRPGGRGQDANPDAGRGPLSSRAESKPKSEPESAPALDDLIA